LPGCQTPSASARRIAPGTFVQETAAMQIEMMATDQLVPYIRNTPTHSADQVAQISASIAEFGFTNPILITEDEVIRIA
jgi:hypothetical protein